MDKFQQEHSTGIPIDASHGRVVMMILQFLQEAGYSGAREALQAESGIDFDKDAYTRGGELQHIINEWHESKQKELLSGKSVSAKPDPWLFQPGSGTYAHELVEKIPLHKANIISVRFSADETTPLIATGSADKTVRLTNYETKETLMELRAHDAPSLSLAFHPTNPHHLLSAGMDGTVAVIDLGKKAVVQEFRQHKKFAIEVKWSRDGKFFASGSHDRSVCIYGKPSSENEYALLKQVQFQTTVEAIEFTPDSTSMLVGLRDDNYLHCIDLGSFAERLINMNANKDDFVSFTPLQLTCTSDGNYVLISTDHDRVLLLHLASSQHARVFYGATNGAMSQPRHCFDLTERYVYSTSQDNKILIWELSSQKLLTSLKSHTSTVRDIVYHPTKHLLASASYDKTVAIWKQ